MQIILTTDVPSLGDAGDLVEVKAGYGANYLIPQGLALPATSSNKNQIEHQRRAISARIARDRTDAEGLAAKLSHLSVTITRLVGDDDKLFGSVSNKDIAEALREQGADDVIVIAGGVIPQQDYDFLEEKGVALIFGPGTPIPEAARKVLDAINANS